MKNAPDEQATLAAELREDRGYLEIQVGAKLSRFELADGVDADE